MCTLIKHQAERVQFPCQLSTSNSRLGFNVSFLKFKRNDLNLLAQKFLQEKKMLEENRLKKSRSEQKKTFWQQGKIKRLKVTLKFYHRLFRH